MRNFKASLLELCLNKQFKLMSAEKSYVLLVNYLLNYQMLKTLQKITHILKINCFA